MCLSDKSVRLHKNDRASDDGWMEHEGQPKIPEFTQQQRPATRFPDRAGQFASGEYSKYKPLLSIAEYRSMLKDQITPDKRIQERIDYIERVIRNIIRTELERYE